MQSNNSPNQLPDPAVSIDPTLANLLIEVISPEDLEGLDELLHLMPGANLNVTDGTGMLQVQTDQMASISPTQMSSQVPSAQPLLTTQMGSMGQMVQLSSTKQMVQTGLIPQYDQSAQPILPLLMMQSPDASAQATSQVQTGGQASGGTQQDIMSENRRLHEENQKLLADNQKLLAENQKLLVENYFLNVGNGAFIKRVQELKLKVQELKLKVKGQVCLHDEMSYIYMDVMKCLLSIWL